MKINATEISKYLPILSRAQATRSTMEILEYIGFVTGSGRLYLTSTDTAISVSVSIPVDSDKEIRVGIPHKVVGKLLPAFGDDELSITPASGNRLIFKSDKAGRHEVKGMALDTMPPVKLPGDIQGSIAVLDKADLLNAMKRVAFSCKKDNTEATATVGLIMRLSGETLVLEATDSLRLTRMDIKVTNPHGMEFTALVLPRAIAALALLSDGEVYISISQNVLYIGDPNTLVSIQLLTHKAPNLQELLSACKHVGMIYIGVNELRQSLSRIAATVPSNVLLDTDGKGSLMLQSNGEYGDGYETIDYPTDCGEPCEFSRSFSVAYLMDGLKHVDGNTIGLELVDIQGLIAVIIRDESWLHLLAPVVS